MLSLTTHPPQLRNVICEWPLTTKGTKTKTLSTMSNLLLMTLSPTYCEENQVQNIACYVQLSMINTNTKTFPTKPNLLQRTLKPKPRPLTPSHYE